MLKMLLRALDVRAVVGLGILLKWGWYQIAHAATMWLQVWTAPHSLLVTLTSASQEHLGTHS